MAVVRPARTLAQKQFVRGVLLAQPSPAVNPAPFEHSADNWDKPQNLTSRDPVDRE
jgi:hypothetical protein